MRAVDWGGVNGGSSGGAGAKHVLTGGGARNLRTAISNAELFTTLIKQTTWNFSPLSSLPSLTPTSESRNTQGTRRKTRCFIMALYLAVVRSRKKIRARAVCANRLAADQ